MHDASWHFALDIASCRHCVCIGGMFVRATTHTKLSQAVQLTVAMSLLTAQLGTWVKMSDKDVFAGTSLEKMRLGGGEAVDDVASTGISGVFGAANEPDVASTITDSRSMSVFCFWPCANVKKLVTASTIVFVRDVFILAVCRVAGHAILASTWLRFFRTQAGLPHFFTASVLS